MSVETPHEPQIMVSDLFNAMADHFFRLARRTDQLEGTIQDISLASDSSNAQTIIHLQNLDYLSQALEDLRLLACGIRDCTDSQCITVTELPQIAAMLTMADSKNLLDPRSNELQYADHDQSGQTLIF